MTRTSGLYVGEVVHERSRPKRHRLRYRIFMLLLDLEDLEALDRSLKRFSVNRPNLLSVQDSDQGVPAGQTLRQAVLAKLAAHDIVLEAPRIALLCMPRVLGHGFNPLSVYFCREADGRLAAIVYAVRNTFGQRHDYVLPVRRERGGWVEQGCGKRFHVSPFMPMNLRYSFEVAAPGETVHVGVDVHDDQGLLLTASFAGAYRPLTDATLMRALLTHPWQIVGVLAAIVWEAVKIALKGFRIYPAPPSPSAPQPGLDPGQEKGGAR